jgi:DNA repair protein RadD
MKARWYQIEATNALMQLLEKDDCHPIIVAPTGSGKSFMICDFIDQCLTKNPTAKILVLSHIKEILTQDFDAISDYFEGFDVGLYSAGLDSRTVNKITVAGIQSIWRHPEVFKDFSIVVIDECHLVTIRQSGMYRKFLSKLKAQYIGYTATHFRLGHGYIHKGPGRLFNEIAYDMSEPNIFNRLVEEGYLTRLITKATIMKMDTDDIKIRAKDFALDELSKKFDRNAVTDVAVNEIIEFGQNYKKWLIFAIDIEHAEHITDSLCKKGINAAVVHSKMDDDRTAVVNGFKMGKYRAVINVDILTTGLDVPDIDLIAMLRPTKSPVIHVQTIGRGLRVAPNKTHCLVLDFAGNTSRLGPINDVVIKQKEKGKGTGNPIVKECPKCQTLQHPSIKICYVCGHKFVFKTNLKTKADTTEVVRTTVTEWHNVTQITYALHEKPNKPTSMKVTYRIGLQTFHEWICFDHEGFAKYKADNWVRFRAPEGMPEPEDVFQLYEWSEWLKKPKKVLVNFSEKFPQIKDAKFW